MTSYFNNTHSTMVAINPQSLFHRATLQLKFTVFASVLVLFGLPAVAANESIVVAGGCFWCVESDFDTVDGVTATTSGYTGGTVANPTYSTVTSGGSGHYEAVKIDFDSSVVSLAELLDKFWRSVDVTDAGGQFCDRGDSYRTAVFVSDSKQRQIASESKAASEVALGQPFVTPILDVAEFYRAEDRHQDYYLGNNRVITRFGIVRQSDAYKRYRQACGRDQRVKELWGEQAAFTH